MNEFELRLESDLRKLLDPITAASVPPRRGMRTPEAPKLVLRVVNPETLATIPVKAF
jgi:hypothetical protein